MLASASSDRSVRLWKLEAAADGSSSVPYELTKLATLTGHTDAVQCLLHHRGRLVSGSADCTCRIWDYTSNELVLTCAMPIAKPQRESTAIHCMAHSLLTESPTFWSGHWGGSLNLWDASTGSLLRNLSRCHEGCVWALQSLTYSPELMASAGVDGVIKLWDERQASSAGEIPIGSPTYALASTGGVTPLLVSAGHDGCLRLWDVRAMRSLPPVQAHRAPIRSLLVQDGSLWSSSTDGTVRSWELS